MYTIGSIIRRSPPVLLSPLRRMSSIAATTRLKSYKDVAYKEGQKILGYTVAKVTPVPELQATAVELVHDTTKAQFLHVARADSNNVFSIGFRTPPTDSSGVTHVLEHVSLCGSKNYPIRDPFFKMTNRSLATYMNAWTASDYTMYPFSTQNAVDYTNLLKVYLDAVFFPNIKDTDFLQEGWRLEHEIPTDATTPLVFKGVVWNEMKGSLSDVDRLYCTRFQQALYPGTTYEHVSGGDPPTILSNLTVEGLRAFHANHYHPSNSRIYTYGDIPLESHLENVAKYGLNHFTYKSINTSIDQVPRWTQPKRVEITCSPDPMTSNQECQTRVSVGWALPSETPYEQFSTRVLASLLVDGSNSPLYKALIESNLGTHYSPNTGLDPSAKEPCFSVGLQGVRQDDVALVEEIIQSTMEKTIEEGFPKERVDAILHQIEFSQKHQTSSFGLNLGASLMGPWIHDNVLADLFQINPFVKKLKEDLKKEGYLEGKMKTLFLKNPHRLTFTMSPDEKFLTLLQEQEQKQLAAAVASLNGEDKTRIQNLGLQLLKEQEKEEDLTALPTLHVNEVDHKILHVEKQRKKLNIASNQINLQVCVQPTNGITYVRALFGTSCIPSHLQPYLPLFSAVLASMGAGSMDYRQQGLYTTLWTGGINVSPLLMPDRNSMEKFGSGILISSKALNGNLENMIGLLKDITMDPHFDDIDRMGTLFKMIYTNMGNSVTDSGHGFAVRRASAGITPYHAANEIYSGLTQIDYLRAIEKNDLRPVMNTLKTIAKHLFRSSNVRCAINVDEEGQMKAEASMTSFLESLSTDPICPLVHSAPFEFSANKTEGLKVYQPLPVQVNYVGSAIAAIPKAHPDYAPLRVLARYLSTRYLHREIREKGGAYGGGLGLNSGVLEFYSYRDPKVESTLRAFETVNDWMIKEPFLERDIEECKLSIFQSLDSPVAPGSRGMSEFIYGVSDEERQLDRDRIFMVSKEDLLRVARSYLIDSKTKKAAVVIGPIENAKDFKNKSGWIVAASHL